jgi:hypothetical protein
MSRLALYGRPYVIFDPKNREHRQWFADFNKSGAWGRCPVRFVVNDDHGDLITMIQRELIQFYVDKEFAVQRVRPKTVAKKQQKKMRILVDE